MDMYEFYTGRAFDAYEFLGCHVTEQGAVFRVFAPAAQRISVIGDFNGWTETPMQKIHDGNFWECAIAGAACGMRYKYRIFRSDGRFIDHCDPYGFGMELRPQNASVIRDLSDYEFHDDNWLRARTDGRDKPLNIYEVHIGSWKTNAADENGWYRYDALAQTLIPYVKECGYNYIELLPVSEHPCDNSWGYQNTGFFSPTSRYGTMNDLKRLIDACHQNGIGVLLDFVPVHFAVDFYALAEFDGTALYEYPHADVGNSEWGSKNFNHSRGEVRSFLQSAASYWIREFHFDGLRMDAISNLIYWQGDPGRGENQGAINFLRNLNKGLKERFPSVILAAEDSTAYPRVTASVESGGLGFDYKWDLGWMNDTLTYMREAPEYRVRDYHKLTFSMMYYYGERYLLPLSHDETVHGKASVLQKMNGEYEEKFPQARAFYMYMYAHPGKKLQFMGNEFGQLREWDEKREQDWDILRFPVHDAFHRFMKELNRIYLQSPALWASDYDERGFTWLDCHQEKTCVYAFMRTDGAQKIIAVFHFSDKPCTYRLRAASTSALRLLLASDDERYAGCTHYDENTVYRLENDAAFSIPMDGFSAKYFLAEG